MASSGDSRQRGALIREESTREPLRDLIANIAPTADLDVRESAQLELEKAIAAYRHGFMYSDGHLLKRSNVAGDRQALQGFTLSLKTALESLVQLQGAPEAMRLLRRRTGIPYGAVKRSLLELLVAVEGATQDALQRPAQTEDAGVVVLAASVATILENTLATKVTMTADRVEDAGIRGGAAYARLLRATLEAAGAKPPDDLLPIMRRGKSLLDTLK